MADTHAQDNAKGWLETIQELVPRLNSERTKYVVYFNNDNEEKDFQDEDEAEAFAALHEESSVNEKTFQDEDDAEKAREEIQEGPLSVQVRSGWHDPNGESEAEEFEILLSTGGPALRIRGDLSEHKEPSRAYLETQDWGTPWTQFFLTSEESDDVLTYCQQFYFGG
jgi:hypothetical protein